MSVMLFGLTKCSTCVQARAWFDTQDITATFQDYREFPISPATLASWAQALGGWEKLVNRASLTWRHLDDGLKTPASSKEWTHLIAQYPALIRRPVIMSNDQTVMVGFSEKRAAQYIEMAKKA